MSKEKDRTNHWINSCLQEWAWASLCRWSGSCFWSWVCKTPPSRPKSAWTTSRSRCRSPWTPLSWWKATPDTWLSSAPFFHRSPPKWTYPSCWTGSPIKTQRTCFSAHPSMSNWTLTSPNGWMIPFAHTVLFGWFTNCWCWRHSWRTFI